MVVEFNKSKQSTTKYELRGFCNLPLIVNKTWQYINLNSRKNDTGQSVTQSPQ